KLGVKLKTSPNYIITLASVFFGSFAHAMGPHPAGPIPAMPYPTIIAHRGASGLAPEETRPSYELARELGADYLELDVQRTQDGVLIAFHDPSLVRTTNVREIYPGLPEEGYELRNFFWDQIRGLDAGTSFNLAKPKRARKSFSGQRVLLLLEVLAIAQSGKNNPGIYLEFKNPEFYPGIEKETVDLLRAEGWITGRPPRSDVKPRLIFQSYSVESLQIARELAPEVPRVLLVSHDEDGRYKKVVETAKSVEASGIGPAGNLFGSDFFSMVSILWQFPKLISQAHDAGLMVHTYTMNPGAAQWLFYTLGVDGIFTDRCDTSVTLFNRVESVNPGKILDELGYVE
ncbi:MAG: glycerophosphodiester phosphodiesterase family protein, partial [Bdellovibrionota bacterium]